jgi:hypothetical protein
MRANEKFIFSLSFGSFPNFCVAIYLPIGISFPLGPSFPCPLQHKTILFHDVTIWRTHGTEVGQTIYPVSRYPFRLDSFYPFGHPEVDFITG